MHAAYNFTRRNVSLLQFSCAFVFSESNVPSYFSGTICIAIIRAELLIPFLSPLCYLFAFLPLGLRPAFILSLNPGLVLRERCHGLSSHLARPRPDVMIEVPLNHCQPSEAIPHTFAMETPSWLMGSQKKAFQNWSSKWFSFSFFFFYFFFLSVSYSEGKNIEQFPQNCSCHIILGCLFVKWISIAWSSSHGRHESLACSFAQAL